MPGASAPSAESNFPALLPPLPPARSDHPRFEILRLKFLLLPIV